MTSRLVPVLAVPAAWTAARAAVARVQRPLSSTAVRPDPVPAAVRAVHRRLTGARTWRRFDEGLPDVPAAVARGLRSGASLRQALAEAAAHAPAPVVASLREVVAAADAGLPLSDALEDWGRRCPRPNVLLLVAALSLAHDTGGASAQAVDGVAATLRRRLAVRAEAVALATQARTSASVLAGAPLVVCAFALLAGGGSARFLLGTPVGLACLALGLVLEAVGAWWMVRITATGVLGGRSSHGHDDRPPRTMAVRRPAVSAGALVVLLALLGRPVLGLGLGAVVLVSAPRWHDGRERRRRLEAVAADLPEIVDLLAVAVGAGLTVREAVGAVARRARGPLAEHLAAVAADADAGRPFADALDDLPVRAGEPTRSLAASLAGCVRYGTPVGPTLAALAVEARDAERRRLEQAARRVPVLLLFPLVLCILPAFALLTVAPLLADALRALRL